MKVGLKIILILIFFSSCQKNKIEDNFILLPSVKDIEYNGKSSIFNGKSNYVFYSESNELPVLLSQTLKLKKGTANKHNLSFKYFKRKY